MGSIAETQVLKPRVGVATSSGRAYYRISNLLKKIDMPFVDVVIPEHGENDPSHPLAMFRGYGIVITTRRERVQFLLDNIVCEEDLGEDAGLAKQKLISLLYPVRTNDVFVIGIDPGERTGIAAFLNQREIESEVYMTPEATLARVGALIDNAPNVRKIVNIGAGNFYRALNIARMVAEKYKNVVEINLVNESGTSNLRRKSHLATGTRDQRAARLIAFRTGTRYSP